MTEPLVITDTHCHLNLNQFEIDLEAVLERAALNGVERILIPGIDLPTSRRAVQLAEQHPSLYAAVGIHPNSANSWRSGTIKEIESLSWHPKVAAIGEIGLDYYRLKASPETQKAILQQQLELAASRKLPVIIHSRQAMQDLMPLLASWHAQLSGSTEMLAERPGVLHAFEGSLEIAEKAILLNFLIGVGGPITYPKSGEKRELIRRLPLDAILTETDAPYLSPQPVRGQRNEPANVKIIVEKIAEIRIANVELVAERTSQNANRLFLWSLSR